MYRKIVDFSTDPKSELTAPLPNLLSLCGFELLNFKCRKVPAYVRPVPAFLLSTPECLMAVLNAMGPRAIQY